MSAITIPFAFLFLAAVLLWLIIGARGWWWLKLIMIATSAALSFEIFQSLQSYLGWPKHSQYSDMPDEVTVYSIRVVEPSTGNPGGIYLWGSPEGTHVGWLDYVPGADDPRSYVLPYSRDAHKKAERLKKTLADQDGVRIAFVRSVNTNQPEGERTNSGEIELYILPPSSLPPKVTGTPQ